MKNNRVLFLIIPIIILLIIVLLVSFLNKEKSSNVEILKMEVLKDYTKPINIDFKALNLDKEIDYDNLEIKSKDENIATVDGLVVKGNNIGNTTLDIYYNNKLMKKIEIEIKNENKEETDDKKVTEEIKITIESQGKKEEKTIQVKNGELQEKLILKKDDIITIEREVPEELSVNDFSNKLRNSSSIEIMSASMGQKDGKKTSTITYKVLEDVEI